MKILLTAMILLAGVASHAEVRPHRACRDAMASVHYWEQEVFRTRERMNHSERLCGRSHRCRETLVAEYQRAVRELSFAEIRRRDMCR